MESGFNNPRVVGLFVLGAMVLAAGTLIFVGSLGLFSREVRCVLYFDESVNGLSVGAPIKYKGVPIGRVSDIRIHENQADSSSAVPVYVRIDTGRLQGELAEGMETDGAQLFGTPISNGLRGMLQLESFITGQLFIELDYVANEQTGAPRFRQLEPLYPEIPTVPSVMARLGTETTDLFAQLSSLDYRELVEETIALLRTARTRLEPLDTAQLQVELQSVLEKVDTVLDSGQMEAVLEELEATLRSVRTTSEATRTELGSFAGSAEELAARLDSVLSGMEVTLHSVNRAVEAGSPLQRNLENALEDFSDLARYLTELVRLLERNPASLLRGRPLPEGGP